MGLYYITQADGSQIPAYSKGDVDETEIITADKTLRVEESGKTIYVATDALIITLPAVVVGVEYEFVNSGADGNNIITLSPDAADAVFGTVSNAAADSVSGGIADKDWINTKATANKGDRVSIIGGVGGWFIKSGVGIWASQA